MINVVDEVLNGEPKYILTHADNTTEEVEIDLSTEVTTEGTPLNKLLFDSIKDDLNSRLLISSKASNSEAELGTNDIKYMTPAKVQHKLNSLITTLTGTNNATLIDFTNYTGKIVRVMGYGQAPSGTSYALKLNGTEIARLSASPNLDRKSAFDITFDLNNFVYSGSYYISPQAGIEQIIGTADSFASLTLEKFGPSNVPWAITIKVSN